MAEAVAPPVAAAPAAAVELPPARPKYVPKPVALGWKDVVRYLEELWHESIVSKIDAPLDVLALGPFLSSSAMFGIALTPCFYRSTASASIKNGDGAAGKVVTIDATLPNIVPYVRSHREVILTIIHTGSFQAACRPRVAERILALCGRLLEQSEEGVDSKVYDAAGAIVVDLFECKDRLLQSSLRAYLFGSVLSSLRFCVDEVKSLGPHVRLAICNVINSLEEIEAAANASTFVLGSVPSFPALATLVGDITQYQAEKAALIVKMKLLRDTAAETNLGEAFAETVCAFTLHLLQAFEELPVSLVNATLDLILSVVCRGKDLSIAQEAVSICIACAAGWSDAVRAQILFKLIELCRVALCAEMDLASLIKLVDNDVRKILQILCRTQGSTPLEEDETIDPYNNWMSGIAARAVECVSLAIERDCAPALAMFVGALAAQISSISGTASDAFTHVVNHEKVLRRALELVNAMLNSAHAIDLFKTAFDDVLFFVSTAFGKHGLSNDADITAKSFELASLFIRQKSDAKVFAVFFREHMVNSFSIPNSWEAYVSATQSRLFSLLSLISRLCL